MHIPVSNVLSNTGQINAQQAASLVLAVAAASERHGVEAPAAGLPPANEILLDDNGRVWFAAPGPRATDGQRVEQLADMLHRLLQLDGRAAGTLRPTVPGALLVLLARARGEIDLPPLTFDGFRQALGRFGSADPATLASIYGRFASPGVASVRNAPATMPPVATGTVGARRPRLPAAIAASVALGAVSFASGWIATRQLMSPDASRPSISAATGGESVPQRAQAETSAAATSGTMSEPTSAAAAESPAASATPGASVGGAPAPSAPPPPAPPAPAPIRGAGPAVVLPASVVGNDAFSPSFAAYGRELLFHAGRSRSALMRASFDDSGRPAVATVLEDGAANYHASQSPDGKWLAYDSDRDGTRGVYVAPRDGGQPRRISGEGYAAVPRWSPEGRKLAFVKAEANRPRVWNVWVADLDARSLTRVSRHSLGQPWSASWFPGGNQVTYSVEDRLIIADLRDGSKRVLPSPVKGRQVRTPAVSPDGKRIVFQVARDGVWLFDVATGTMRRVLTDRTAEEFAWSPDGTRVIYHARHRGAWALWQVALEPA